MSILAFPAAAPKPRRARRSSAPAPRAGIARGVYLAPWIGPNGETILMAVTRRGRLLGELVTVPRGECVTYHTEAMWRRLDADDSEPALRIMR